MLIAVTKEVGMFERYTEKARRVIFFARYEASAFGSPSIETEHLLLGLLREDKALTRRFLQPHEAMESIRKHIEEHTTIREKVPTSVDLPLSNECKRVLAYSAEEAELMGHKYIGTEHLLLGIMREEKCFATEILRVVGVPGLAEVRKSISDSAGTDEGQSGRRLGPGRYWPSIRLVEEESGRVLLEQLSFQGMPRIGEAVQLTGDGEDEGYLVVDVWWGFHRRADGEHDDVPTLRTVEIRVRREEFGKAEPLTIA
jgi:hypothetical protein